MVSALLFSVEYQSNIGYCKTCFLPGLTVSGSAVLSFSCQLKVVFQSMAERALIGVELGFKIVSFTLLSCWRCKSLSCPSFHCINTRCFLTSVTKNWHIFQLALKRFLQQLSWDFSQSLTVNHHNLSATTLMFLNTNQAMWPLYLSLEYCEVHS